MDAVLCHFVNLDASHMHGDFHEHASLDDLPQDDLLDLSQYFRVEPLFGSLDNTHIMFVDIRIQTKLRRAPLNDAFNQSTA